MHAVKFYRRYWAAIGGLILVALAFFVGLFGDKDNVDKYPLNEMSALMVNVFCAFPVVAFSTILLSILSFRKKDTPYGFAQYQADEFEVRHGIASLFRKN